MSALPTPSSGLPLSGIRVLDLGTTIAGPSATRVLADFGAQVIKIETSHHLDTLRLGTPYAEGVPGPNRSGYFAAYNAGKLSMALNLKVPAASGLLQKLIEVSDVLVEANVPGVIERLRALGAELDRRVRAFDLDGGPPELLRDYEPVLCGVVAEPVRSGVMLPSRIRRF